MLNDFHAGKRSPPDGTRTTDGSSDLADDTLESLGVMAALKASRETAASPELTPEYKVSSRVTHAHRQAISKRNANADSRTAAATTTDVKPGVSPAPTPSASPSSTFESPFFSSSPRNDHWVKNPDHSLPVGESLTGLLKSGDGRSVVWPGVDGCLRFGKFETPVAENGSGAGFGVIRPTSLIGSDNDKASEALLLRKELREEAGGSGEESGKMEKEAKAGGNWWSWRGLSKRRKREIAAKKAGEICVTVTNQGGVQATVDGTIVISESGPSKWGWINRRTVDEGYELHVTDTGVEVRLEGRAVWGITAD